MGKKHSKENSEKRNQLKTQKYLKEKRHHMSSRCRFLIKQMHEGGKNNGFVAWLGFKKDEDEPVVLKASFIQYGDRVHYEALQGFIHDLTGITKSYVRRMTLDNINRETPENVVRTMATVLWNQAQAASVPSEISE